VDPDLLRWHVSIQPFPVVIPSPLIGSVGALFRSKRRTNGFDVMVIECAPPRTGELSTLDRQVETRCVDDALGAVEAGVVGAR